MTAGRGTGNKQRASGELGCAVAGPARAKLPSGEADHAGRGGASWAGPKRGEGRRSRLGPGKGKRRAGPAWKGWAGWAGWLLGLG